MKIENSEKEFSVYTTRVDTVFGMTYAVLAPEHKILGELREQIKNWNEVEEYVNITKKKTDLDRMEAKVKTGVELKGVRVINPFNGESLPLFVADYVLAQYGTGAVMAVPAHDERDFEFAKKYALPIREVIEPCFWQTIEPGKIREGEPFVERDAICAIVKHWEKNEYIVLKWKKVAWQTFITGGPEDNQTAQEGAEMEVREEAGYKNLKLIEELPITHSKFYHVPKKINRFAHFRTFYFELENGEQEELSELEKGNHEVTWVLKEEIEKSLTSDAHKYVWSVLNGGENVYTEDGILANSKEFDGLESFDAREKLTAWLEEKKIGEKKINYRLRDWLVSRQRYWGAPIPIIYCDQCGEVPVPEADLPVELPNDVDFKPTGESPLKYSEKFQNVSCPKCGAKARRESDTMDTFVCSSWYYLRYADSKNDQEFASKELLKKWLPVDLYVGGAEHSVLHLLYARFFTKVLHNLGYLEFDEPFLKLRHQGTILAEDGTKMSKSKGNVVNPDDVVAQYGADALRCFEMFMGPLEDMKPWQTKGIVGIYRFLEKVWKMRDKILNQAKNSNDKKSKINSLIHKTIKKVSKDIEAMHFNTAISQLMILVNALEKEEKISTQDYQLFLTLLSPFAPHLAEEIWEKLGHSDSIFLQKWPEYDPELIKDEEIALVIQVNGKVRDTAKVSADISEEEATKLAISSEKIKNYIAGKEIKKVIFVKGRLINVVI
jgi:leucyl-tRNA synthetase